MKVPQYFRSGRRSFPQVRFYPARCQEFRRSLRHEMLEKRQMLAGDVSDLGNSGSVTDTSAALIAITTSTPSSVTDRDGIIEPNSEAYTTVQAVSTNDPVTLSAIPAQTFAAGTPQIIVQLKTSDPDPSQVLSYDVTAQSIEYHLRTTLGLSYGGAGEYQNWFNLGLQEKWLKSSAPSGWHYILPNGKLYQWSGLARPSADVFVEQLSPAFYQDTSLLYMAQANQAPALLSLMGNELRIYPNSDFVGRFWIQATVDDGYGSSDTQSFFVNLIGEDSAPVVLSKTPDSESVNAPAIAIDIVFSKPVVDVDASDLVLTGIGAATAVVGTPLPLNGNSWRFPVSGLANGPVQVALASSPDAIQDLAGNELLPVQWSFQVDINQPPVLANIQDITLDAGIIQAEVLLSASDPDVGDTLMFSASAQSIEYYLDRTLQLEPTGGNEYLNYLALGEKWLISGMGAAVEWYYVTPTGHLYRWAGGPTPVGDVLVDQVSPAAHADTSLLYDALPDNPPTQVAVHGNQLLITPQAGFVGRFVVMAQVQDDRGGTDSQSFAVSTKHAENASNHPPVLSAIADQIMTTALDTLVLALAATDDDVTDILTFRVTGQSQAHQLRTEHGLGSDGSFYQNYLGLNERWLTSSTSPSGWCYITPSGQLRQWNGDFNSSADSVLASLSVDFWNDPSLLYKAPPNSLPASLTLSGNQLTIDPDAFFIGEFFVTAIVSDGQGGHDSQQFKVTVV